MSPASWKVVDVVVDNDTGAPRKDGKLADRPEFDRLVVLVEAKRVDAVVAWEVDRLTSGGNASSARTPDT